MEINTKNMGSWSLQKAGYLLVVAGNLNMELDGSGVVDVNENSGYVYLWLEDYSFTLYMPICCELVKSDVWALWSDDTGFEYSMRLLESTTLTEINQWVYALENNKDVV